MNLAPPGRTEKLPGDIPDLQPEYQSSEGQSTPQSARRGRQPRPRSILDITDLQSSRSPRRGPNDTPLSPPMQIQPSQVPIRVRSPSPNRTPTGRSPSPLRNPFNFESVPISASPVRPTHQRKGHRYKHSSVSINFFQEPEVRNPLAIPVSHEIPTLKESWQSTTRLQVLNLLYAFSRIVLVWALFTGPHTTHSTSALAHLVAYDVVAHVIVVAVDVLGNFEVWKQSSLRLPFALQRSEVLIGFALAITLVFFGFDIFSHVIQDIAQQVAGEEHAHHHGRPDEHSSSSGAAFALCLINTLTVVARLVNLDNPWAENAIGCVTAAFCVVVIVLPYLGNLTSGIDLVLTPLMSLSMIYFGWQVSKYFGGMLVMSHVGPDNTAELEDAISHIPHVASVSDISIWQVHHDLWLANVKIVMSGTDDDETAVRKSAEEKMRAILAQDDSTRVETTVDISRTTLD